MLLLLLLLLLLRVAAVVEVDAIDFVAIEAHGAAAAEAAPLFEFDLPVTHADELALQALPVAKIERVGLQADGQRQHNGQRAIQRWGIICILLRTVCRDLHRVIANSMPLLTGVTACSDGREIIASEAE